MIQTQRILYSHVLYAMDRYRGNCPIYMYMYMHVQTHMGQRKHGSFQMLYLTQILCTST